MAVPSSSILSPQPVRHRGTYERVPVAVTFTGWRLALLGSSFAVMAVTTVLAVVTR